MAPSPKKSSDLGLTPIPGEGCGEDEVEFGYISGIFGVRGEVRVHLHNRESDYLMRTRTVVLLDLEGRRFKASLRCRPGAGKRILGLMPAVQTRDDAAAKKGWKILIASRFLPQLEEGEFYVWRVVGLPVFVGDVEVGTVTEVHSSGPIDIFEIRTPEGTRFVPALKENLTVDLEAGRVDLCEDVLVEG